MCYTPHTSVYKLSGIISAGIKSLCLVKLSGGKKQQSSNAVFSGPGWLFPEVGDVMWSCESYKNSHKATQKFSV